MILYLLKSTLCMATFLLFYKFAIEDVTMHRFKRGYLLGVLILSFLIPFLPTGYNYVSDVPMIEEGLSEITNIGEIINAQEVIEPAFSISFSLVLGLLLLIISTVYFSRFIRNIRALIQKASSNQRKQYHSTQLVLTEENEVPHTFLDYIYINKKDYLNGDIDEQLLVHERAHADQKHSWDIIFIEAIMCLFWFNPILRMYKTAIQLNHEFLADETVIKQYTEVKKYQYLLLDTIKNNNQISLASSINFSLTKKRLEMMTKKSTARKKNLLVLSVLPVILVLLVAMGSPVTAQYDADNNTSLEQKQNALRDMFFAKASIHYIGKDGLEYVKKYNSIPDYIKNQLMVPPPPPSTKSGKPQWQSALKKGTIVTLKGNGSIHIGGDINVPPPPPPPEAPYKRNGIGSPPPPPTPPSGIKGNIPPPPPPPPIKVKHLAEQGVSIYINGKKVFDDVAKTICEDLDDNRMKLITEKDGTKSLYIDNQD